MKLFILLCVVAGALATQCGKNQHYNNCGTACPLTCDNYDNPPKACVLMCNPGCHCDAGYVKTADGACVRPQECPAKSEQECGLNERFTECGTDCPLTCENYSNPPKFCNAMCRIGCECEEGYVRDTRGGRCVKSFQCPQDAKTCGLNERFTECGTDCPLTCENYSNPPKICNLMCRIGCECEEGYVRDTRGGRCVKSFQCPQDAAIPKTCIGKPETGMCRAYMPSWHYDVKTEKCHRFIYGGCGGNGNRYATEEECMEHCGAIKMKKASGACDLPSETGVCRGFFPRYFFDRTTGQCEKFVYGGCGGNENNFETIEECQQTCDVQASEDVCELPAETGLCRGYFPRFHFDKDSGECKKFIYGGCGGNENNFRTVEECQNVCA